MTLTVSQSRLKDWRRCHALHNYKWNQHLRRKAPSRPLWIGTIVHEMLDAHATGGKPAKILKRHERAVKPYLREDPEQYGDLISTVSQVFDNYLIQYEEDGLEYVESEVELRVELLPDIELVVHIDKVVVDKQKRLWTMDHKCHRNIPPADQRMADLQLVIYPWVWNEKKPKKKMTGVIWDYLRTKVPTVPRLLQNGQLSQTKNIDTTYEVYYAEIKRHNLDILNYAGFLEYLKGQTNTFYERVFLPVANDAMLQNILNDAKSTSREIRDAGKALTDRNLRWDCKMCQFFDLCQAELRGLDSEFIKKSRYNLEVPRGSEEEIDD